jgi:hypothetical protein
VSAVIDLKLAQRVKAKLKEQDDKIIEMISSGNIPDWGQYQRKLGYRKALSDCELLINETLEDILKE